jgi:putative sterol carrier protein
MSKTAGFFNEYLPNKLKKNPDLASSIKANFFFDITGAGQWTLDLKGTGGVSEGKGAEVDCTITAAQADWEAILDAPAKAVTMVMMGKLKVSNLGLATQLQKILA